jgi:hypothetical protein
LEVAGYDVSKLPMARSAAARCSNGPEALADLVPRE